MTFAGPWVGGGIRNGGRNATAPWRVAVPRGDRHLDQAARLWCGARTCACSAVHFTPSLRKIRKRKLDIKLFCLAAGRRRRSEGGLREGSLLTGSLKAETQNPGEHCAPRQPCAPGHLHRLLCSCDLAAVNVHCAVPRSHVQIRMFLLFLVLLAKYPRFLSCRTKSEVVFTYGNGNTLFLQGLLIELCCIFICIFHV